MKNNIFCLLMALFPLCMFAQKKGSADASKQSTETRRSRPAFPHVYKVMTYIHHISDINYRDGEYKIELWLLIRGNDSLWFKKADLPYQRDSIPYNLIDQLVVKDAKEFKVEYVPQWIHPDSSQTTLYRRLFKIDCTMINKWEMEHFPFDDQQLEITIYTINPSRWVLLDTGKITYSHASKKGEFQIDNDWYFIEDSVKLKMDSIPPVFGDKWKLSALHYKIPLIQDKPWLLFIKLFLGMYVAFWVAFIALFIPVESEEPRFGLPVGGLFAAIGNKYIIESLLPVSTDFTLVDTLHSVTIVFILLIIAYSAILIFLNNRKKDYELKNGKLRFFIFRRIDLIKIDIKNFNLLVIILLCLAYFIINLYFTLVTINQSGQIPAGL